MNKATRWIADVGFTIEGRRLIVSELVIKADSPSPPKGGITMSLVRFLLKTRPGKMAPTIAEPPAGTPGEFITIRTSAPPPFALAHLVDPARKTPDRRRGRPPLPVKTLLSVAEAYAGAIDRGSTHPVADVARRLKMTPELVRDRVLKARRQGLLTEARWGRSGGELTPAAARLMKAKKRVGK